MALALVDGAQDSVNLDLQYVREVNAKLTPFFAPRRLPIQQGGENYDPEDGQELLHQFYAKAEQPLPRAISDRFDEVECRLDMGFFPEIRHAWITVDCRLYLWDYNHRDNHFFPYDRLDQVILSVALVKQPPKGQRFTDEVEYVLAVATLTEIVLLAVVFDAERRVRLRPTDYSLATDETSIVHMGGLDSRGRLFMAAMDGNLYELEYNEENSFYSHVFGANKCRKKNHSSNPTSVFWPSFLHIPGFSADAAPLEHLVVDQERNLLYTLSSGVPSDPKAKLMVYDLGADGTKCDRGHPITIDDDGEGIVSLTVVPRRDAEDPSLPRHRTTTTDLVAITTKGKRMFVSSGVRMPPAHRTRPDLRMQLNHKPGYRSADLRERDVLAAFWSYDVALFATGAPEEQGVAGQDFPLFATCRDPPLDRKLGFPKEVVHEFPSTGSEVFAIAEDDFELPRDVLRRRQPLFLPLDELAAQYRLRRQREFVCLAGAVSVGQEPRLLRYAKRRPIDQLQRIIHNDNHGHAGALEFFQSKYCNPVQEQADQFCCMCIEIACAGPSADAGERGARESTSNRAVRRAIEYGRKCDALKQQGQHHLMGAPVMDGGCLVDGLWLYIARLTEQFWSLPLCEKASGTRGPRAWSRKPEEWCAFREPLELLQRLLGDNKVLRAKVENGRKHVIAAELPMQGANPQAIIAHHQATSTANRQEVLLFKACKFLQRCIEGLWLLQILGFHGDREADGSVKRDVCAQIAATADNATVLQTWVFSNLVVHKDFDGPQGYARKMSEQALGNAGEGSADQVRLAQELHRNCESFFPVGDQLVILGDQCFQFAMSEVDAVIKEQLFQDALDKYREAASKWNSHEDVRKHLSRACKKFMDVGGRQGQALELALACASRYEEQWYGGHVGNFDECRGICHDTIKRVIIIPLLDITPWSTILTKVLDRALHSNDAQFHQLLYAILWEHKHDAQFPGRTLLEGFETPHIEQFLAQQNEQVHYYHYLLHVRDQPDRAARVMFKYAMRPPSRDQSIELDVRLDLLNKAIGSAQMCGTVSLRGRRAGSAFPDEELHHYKAMRVIVKLQIKVKEALKEWLDRCQDPADKARIKKDYEQPLKVRKGRRHAAAALPMDEKTDAAPYTCLPLLFCHPHRTSW